MNNIKFYRKKKGLTQTELGILCGVSKNTISAWENEVFSPTIDNIKNLLYALNTDFNNLFCFKE